MNSHFKIKSWLKVAPIALLSFLAYPSATDAQDRVRIKPNASLEPQVLDLFNSTEFKLAFAESYKAETDIEPKVQEEEILNLQAVLELISDDQLDEAAVNILGMLDRNEVDSPVFDFTLGNIYFQSDELEEAAVHYQNAVNKFPNYRRAWKNLGIIYIREQNFEEAIPALTKVLELGETTSIIYGLLGYAYSSTDNFLSAESAYRNAIMLDPETIDWKMGLARSFFKQERFAEAISLTKLLLTEDSENADLWLLQANAYIGLNQPMEAAEIYELVDMLGKSTVDSLYILGDIYINEELYNIASDSYLKAMEVDTGNDADRAIRAAKILAARSAFEETKELVEAIKTKHGSSLEESTQIDLLRLEARISVAQGKGDEEAKILEEIVEIDPLDGEALILLGQYYSRNEDPDKAIFYYELAQDIEGFEADANIRHAQLLVGLGKYAEALPLLRRAQQVNYRENIQEYLEQVEKVAKAS